MKIATDSIGLPQRESSMEMSVFHLTKSKNAFPADSPELLFIGTQIAIEGATMDTKKTLRTKGKYKKITL